MLIQHPTKHATKILMSMIFFATLTTHTNAGSLTIINNESVPLIMTLRHRIHCFRTNHPLAANGKITEIPAKSSIKLDYWHAGAWRGCGGTAAEFELDFAPFPKIGTTDLNKIAFWFDRGQGFGIAGAYPNHFPGTLSGSGSDRVFTTNANLGRPKLGKAIGDWVSVRTGGTAKGKLTMSKSFNVGGSNEKTVSTETRRAISATVEAGVEYGVGSASLSVTGSSESAKTEASAIAKTFENGGEVSCEQEIDTEAYDYDVMWQWQVAVTGDAPATIATCTVGCTKTGDKPRFLPGSTEQLRSCKIPREAPPAVQPATPAPARTATNSSANMDVAPPSSALSIWIPSHWAKKNASIFDMSVGDSGDEVQVGFKFMNASAAAAQTSAVAEELSKMFGTLMPQGETANTQLGGMPAEMREFKGTINAPGNALNGKTVDVLMVLVQAPHNQIVGVFAFGVADFSSKHQADITNILQALRPR
jgi:hypothetical protein